MAHAGKLHEDGGVEGSVGSNALGAIPS